MSVTEKIIKAMQDSKCYEGFAELYHRWFGTIHIYLHYDPCHPDTLRTTKDLEVELDEYDLIWFITKDDITNIVNTFIRSMN